jgi:glycosyltransferase involved in cell wall biosynthesis
MIINYASSIFFFFFYGLYQALFHKYDCIFVHNTSPAFICLPAILVKKIQRIPLDHWILDMWPESLVASGFNIKIVNQIIEKMMSFIYRNSDVLHISSMGFRKLLLEKGVPDEKIIYFPNFCEDTSSEINPDNLPILPKGFKIMFAGNLGEAQNLENVILSALLLKKEKEIQWIFVGDGRKKAWMENFVVEHQLQDTVHLVGRFPIEMMSSFFEQADVMLVSLADKLAFNLVLPAKVQAYMMNTNHQGNKVFIIGKNHFQNSLWRRMAYRLM